MDFFWNLLPLQTISHLVLLSSAFIPLFGLLFPQGNGFLCTLIGSSGSSLLFLFSNFLLIFLSSLLNLVPLLFIPHFLMFLLLPLPGTSLRIRHLPHRRRAQQRIPQPLQLRLE